MAKKYDRNKYQNLKNQKASNEHQQEVCQLEINEIDAKIDRLRDAYNTLDDAETAKFKPVYTKYMEEMRAVRDMNPRAPRSTLTDAEVEQVIKARFAQSRKMLDIREKYYNEFRKFLSPKQIQKMYNMEKRIGDKMRKEMGKRQGMKKNNSNSRR